MVEDAVDGMIPIKVQAVTTGIFNREFEIEGQTENENRRQIDDQSHEFRDSIQM
jgi:hypothetical protein